MLIGTIFAYLVCFRKMSVPLTLTLLSGKLNAHLEEIDRSANEMFDLLVKQYAEREGVTEQLKAENQMEWVKRMNSIICFPVKKPYSELKGELLQEQALSLSFCRVCFHRVFGRIRIEKSNSIATFQVYYINILLKNRSFLYFSV